MMTLQLIIIAISASLVHFALSEDIGVTEALIQNEVGNGGSNEVHVKGTDIGWSTWSTWSTCSRSCSGGVTYQIRKCQNKNGCDGEATKYRICNMEPCPDVQDFRATQCSAYNGKPYRNRLYEWLPYLDPEDPCSLTCTARSYSFVAKLAPKIKDGTRCREGSLDMCVDGKCLAVGCDLVLGSERKVDECGVCGGDGSTCRRPVYVWGKTPFSPCSVSCGGGYQMSRPVCLNKANEKEVDELLCDRTARPAPEIKECNPHKCPPVWVTDSWSPCSASCGGGRQSRQVHCAQMGNEGVRSPVSADQCQKQKPLTERACNSEKCPKWIIGPWSGCSVTCGKGQKIRSVACEDAKRQHSEGCDVEQMPKTRQDCDSGLICKRSEDPGTYLFSDIFKGSQEDAPPSVPFWSSFPKKSTDVSTEPSYVVGEWEPCSVTCGQGFRKRTVDCKIFLEFSRTVAKLQDYECPGTKPPAMESCYLRPCSFDQNRSEDRKKLKGHYVGIEVTYSWRSNGFTPCSASCLGGTRESVIQCIRDHDQAVVKATQCDISKKPDAITQTCNDHPCPPKWNVSDFTPCSKQCGGGEMTRKVQCLHEVLRGAANTLVVENSNCPQPPPLEKQFCNVFECPSQWKTEPWSKCSKSCGGGEKVRKIRCMKEKAFGQVVELAPSQCSKHRPKTQKICNTKPCPEGADIVPSHGDYIQKNPQKRVFLKVGGKAVVFAETNLKIRCPSRNANKTNILWFRNDDQIKSNKRLKVSMKGALRIRRINMKDSGKYTCMSGSSKADIFVTVKPLPPTNTRTGEDRTVESLQPPTPGTKDKDTTSEEKFGLERKPIQPSFNNKNYHTIVTNPKNKAVPPNKVDFSNSVEDTYEDKRQQFHYKTNSKNNQDSHQDFNNKVKYSSTENSIASMSSTTSRIPLYLQVQSTIKPDANPMPTIKILVKPLDSDELNAHRGQYDIERNRHRMKNKIYDTTSEEKPPNHIYPPRYGDIGKQTYDGAQVLRNKKKEIYDRNDLVSDQEELNIGTPHGGKGFPGSVESSASSIHGSSHIKTLLRNLPSLSTTDDGDIVPDFERESSDMEQDENSFSTLPKHMVANSVVLGKGKAENLEFDWIIGEWSPCSQSCGGSGYQVRSTQCLVKLNNVSKPVDSTLCEDYGLPTPTTIQSCGYEDCPHWETAPWSTCLDSQCFTWHTSYEKRAIYCRSANGTDLPHSQCEEKTRPRRKRECYNSKCRSTWKVGEWSECTASCGRQGIQSRILQCVWYGSTRPAGNACRDQQRPIVLRPCKGPTTCQSNNCTDRSSYCSLAKTLHLCRLSRYHLQCCESCRTRKSKG